MSIAAPTRHILRIADLDPDRLAELLDLAERMKHGPNDWNATLRGRSVACYFTKPSTRTRVSFEAACWHLGALPVMLRPDELQRVSARSATPPRSCAASAGRECGRG
jgi:ornithine carbamoyltransferase